MRCWSSNSGANWAPSAIDDMMFETQGSGSVEISGVIAGTSVFSATIHILTTYEIAGTFAGVSVFSATISATQSSAVVTNTEPIFTMYLVTANNSRIYYEEIS